MKAIAFYLPQYHPISENDHWWGRGFTDWVNVAKARPFFRGHHQPHIPADLGFYDLRLREARMAQAELAREYGIGGFCYYHYYFNGKLLLEKPLEFVLADQEPDFPFCVCWANETWNRRWDGREQEVLIKQDHEQYDPEAHFEYLSKAFFDPRYICVEGKPVFLVYRIDEFPNIQSIIRRWRVKAQSMGLPGVYVCAVLSHRHNLDDEQTVALGFDAIVGFEPHWKTLQSQFMASSLRYNITRFLNRLRGNRFVVYDYPAMVNAAMKRQETAERRFPCVTPSFDNSARAGGVIIQNEDAELFEAWLRDAAARVASYPDDEKLVFINAWNEWAEGCHLEPDLRNGHRFLQAVSKVFGGAAMSGHG